MSSLLFASINNSDILFCIFGEKYSIYLLTVTLAIPMFVMLLFLVIIASSELAFVSAFKDEKVKDKKFFIEGVL